MTAPSPRLVLEYYDNDASTFGPTTLAGTISDAVEAGWSWYSRFPANAYFTLRQDSIHNSRLDPLKTHVRIWYVNDATGHVKTVFTGRLTEPDSTADDVIWTAWNYQSELSLSRTGYRTLYPNKKIGSEIFSPEWTLAKNATYSLLKHVATGTIQDPLGQDDVTPMTTDARFGVIDVPRLLLFYDLSEIGRANTLNNVTFGITREPPFTMNFLKNAGTARPELALILRGSVLDYRFVPGFAALRNDLATLGTTAGGGATEIIKTDETNAAEYGRRQDVFTIKTLAGVSGAPTESDAQVAITARAVKEATQLSRNISLFVRNDLFEPFKDWDIEDTVTVGLKRGRDNIDTSYRIIGARGRMTKTGYKPELIVQLPTA